MSFLDLSASNFSTANDAIVAEEEDEEDKEARRKLSESAGQMLYTLIVQGTKETKRLIIDAIIATVQQPGSVPPEEVPELMDILRESAA